MPIGPGTSCCCTTDCIVCSDAYGRSDGTDITTGSTCGWTETAGSWSLVSGQLETVSANAIAKCNAAHPGGIASAVVQVTGTITGSPTDEYRVYVNYTNATNNHFAQVSFDGTTPCLALYDNTTGTPALLTSKTVPGLTGTDVLKVWFDNATGIFAATCAGVTVKITGQAGTGTYVALGTGACVQVDFDTFSFTKYSCDPFVDDCTLGSDDFSGDLGCSWEIVSGSASSVSGELKMTTNNTRVRYLSPNGDGGAMYYSVSFKGEDNKELHFIIGDDKSTHFYAKLFVGATKAFTITDNTGSGLGGATVSTTPGSWYTMNICLADGRITATIVGVRTISFLVTVPTAVCYAGLMAVGVTTAAYFDNFVLLRGYDASHPTCTRCGASGTTCSDCCDDPQPDWIVTIPAGLTNKATCTYCASTEGEFVIEPVAPGGCRWDYCQGDCSDTCDDGDATFTGSCDMRVATSGDAFVTCGGMTVTGYLCIDEDGQCFMMVQAGIATVVCPGPSGSMQLLAAAWYETPIGDPIDPCSGTEYTLTRYDGADHCGGSDYRGCAKPYPPVSAGCNGSWPATITVRSA